MIICGITLQTSSVLQINDLLFYSCPDLTLCCSADLISDNLSILLSEASNLWKQGKSVNLIIASNQYQNHLSQLLSHLSFPISCKLIESNRYNRVLKSEEFFSQSPFDINIDLKSGETFKVLKLNSLENTFLTTQNVNFNIMVVVPKLSTRIENFPLDKGSNFIVAEVDDVNVVQCLTFVGRANKSLSLASGPDKLYQILMKYKDRLGRVSEILQQENLSFQQLIQQNRLLNAIDHSF